MNPLEEIAALFGAWLKGVRLAVLVIFLILFAWALFG